MPVGGYDADMAVSDVRVVGLRDDTPMISAAARAATRGRCGSDAAVALETRHHGLTASSRSACRCSPSASSRERCGPKTPGALLAVGPEGDGGAGSWIVYASYMHLHTRNNWRGYRCALVNVFGFATIVFCYLGVNIGSRTAQLQNVVGDSSVPSISERKSDHLRINLDRDSRKVENGFDRYRFVHRSLPEIDLRDVDASLEIFGKRLSARF